MFSYFFNKFSKYKYILFSNNIKYSSNSGSYFWKKVRREYITHLIFSKLSEFKHSKIILIFSLELKESINDIKIEITPSRGSSKYIFVIWIEGEKTKQDINKFTKAIYELKSIMKSSFVFIKI